ncbi:hypothetical protein BC940DRAFT_71208 [Gongronella butleri]|nr:hypothetical protein BC940DRAFT_71208 [Gongronella butleri]
MLQLLVTLELQLADLALQGVRPKRHSVCAKFSAIQVVDGVCAACNDTRAICTNGGHHGNSHPCEIAVLKVDEQLFVQCIQPMLCSRQIVACKPHGAPIEWLADDRDRHIGAPFWEFCFWHWLITLIEKKEGEKMST